jgi:hypothetical protein
VIFGERLLCNQRVCFTVPQIAWGRTNEFGNFMGVLEFRAVYLNYGPFVPEQDLRSGLHNARLSDASGPQQQDIPHGMASYVKSRGEYLIKLHERLHCLILPDDSLSESILEMA